MKPLVLYHANCWDGFCAAWVVRLALGDIEAVPVQYGQAPPDCTGRDVYIVDFSYKRDILLEMIKQAAYVTIMDHHEAAEKELKDLPGAYVNFDITKSGARLTWEHFYPQDPAPWLVDYTEDRDLWKWQLPHSREISAWLRSHPLDFELWDMFAAAYWTSFINEGAAILRCEKAIVADHVKRARLELIAGHVVPVVNASCFVSEIAGELAKGRRFAACYFDNEDGKRVHSLRSDPDGLNVAEIAKMYGGGGHKHAAGFST